METMDPKIVVRLNELWCSIYPPLTEWIGRVCEPKGGRSLELGPFSGGISRALMDRSEKRAAFCVMSQEEVARAVKAQFGPGLEIAVGPLEALPFGASFEMVVFRGAFFFLTPKMIQEAYRVLKPGAPALLGGGYGPLTPPGEIDRIAEESKRLNYELGKKWISRSDLEKMVEDAGKKGESQILEQGGLWLLLRKNL